MTDIKTKFKILQDTLKLKKKILLQILTITENQHYMLLSSEKNDNLANLFTEMNNEKQKLIDELLKSDSFFQSTFDEIGEEFEQFALNNKDLINEMKAQIKNVIDLDVKIRIQEQRNKEQTTKITISKKINLPKTSKNYLLNQYKKNNKKTD